MKRALCLFSLYVTYEIFVWYFCFLFVASEYHKLLCLYMLGGVVSLLVWGTSNDLVWNVLYEKTGLTCLFSSGFPPVLCSLCCVKEKRDFLSLVLSNFFACFSTQCETLPHVCIFPPSCHLHLFSLLLASVSLWPSVPPQGVGGNDGWGTEHADPPQRGRASFTLRQWPHGHVFQGPLDRRVGHGLANWH